MRRFEILPPQPASPSLTHTELDCAQIAPPRKALNWAACYRTEWNEDGPFERDHRSIKVGISRGGFRPQHPIRRVFDEISCRVIAVILRVRPAMQGAMAER